MGAIMKIETQILNGMRVGRFAGNTPLGSAATIQEAIDYGYVVGKPEVISALVSGVLKAMARGVQKDGYGRKVDGVLTMHAFPSVWLKDITDDLRKEDLKVNLRARTLKDMSVNTSNWSFVIEGATGSIVVTVVTTGEEDNTVKIGEDVIINGNGLAMEAGDKLTWKVSESGVTGEVAASAITSGPTRITVAAAALAALADDPDNAGRTIVFTGLIGGRKFVKSAVIRL